MLFECQTRNKETLENVRKMLKDDMSMAYLVITFILVCSMIAFVIVWREIFM